MSSFFLSFDGDQINEAISGSHFLLRDSWGFTGDLKLQGDSYLSGINSKKVATFDLVVTGSQTGHGSLTNLNFTNTNNFSATGNSFLSTVTGRSNFDVISVKTGFLPLVTGDSTFYNGDFVFTGFNFYSTGTDFSFLSESNFSVVGIDIFKISGFDKLNVTTDEFNYKGRSHFDGNAYFTGDFHVSGEVYVSGIKLTNITGATINIINQISFDGSIGIGQFYQAKGDILVGTGISGAQTLILGTHGQVLQVDTGHSLGVKWVPSGAFGGGGFGVSGATGLSGWYEVQNSASFLIPQTGSFAIGKGNAIGSTNTDSHGVGTNNMLGTVGGYNNSFGTLNSFTESSYGAFFGYANTGSYSSYLVGAGAHNNVRNADYSFVGGFGNSFSGVNQIVLGRNNQISGLYFLQATGYNSILIGTNNFGASDTNQGGNVLIGVENDIYGSDHLVLGRNNTSTLTTNYELNSTSSVIIIGDINSYNTGSVKQCLGRSNSLNSGSYQSVLGYNNTVTGSNHLILGNNHVVSCSSNAVCLGVGGTAKRYGELVWSNNSNSLQSSDFMFYGTTTNNTQTEIFLGGNSSSRLIIDSGKTMLLHFLVVAKTTTEMASYSIKVVAKNIAGTLTVSTTSLEVIQEDDSTWTVAFDADNTNKSVRVRVTGANSKSITWGIKGFGIEV